ncbi:hypothetical protein LTR97_008815 [Elasticomyces elasticus]|uniref:NAD(P)-binding protein n=1 Tax=Elasticomyces elasticus TaxID=574655 RepID=A0AAN7W6A1_9PEZI|nr:hypothetical protein LTR97_008815 [Elasticomyces elasticus]KAK5714195.1 hypothetical protein LTR15_011103 [Elasticomyces elasticus]
MPTAVITGANSGIGFAFAQILAKEGYDVYACDRDISDKIKSLKTAKIHQLDVTSPESISAFARELDGRPVHVLLNVAGIMSPPEQDSVNSTTKDVLMRTFEVNTFGPLLLTQALLPNLVASERKLPKVAIVSSRVGSISDNSSGGSYAYRASKAAVNAIGKNLAIDLQSKGIVVSILHPGITNTNINPSVATHPECVEPEEAAGKLWKVLQSKDMSDTGKFWHREGYELPW